MYTLFDSNPSVTARLYGVPWQRQAQTPTAFVWTNPFRYLSVNSYKDIRLVLWSSS